MLSAYHNLPTIGGVMQHEGVTYRASELKYETSDAAVSFQANLATAYPKEAGARRWIRTLTLDRVKGIVTISEDFALEKPADVMLSLMTAVAPFVQPNGVKIGGALLAFDQGALKADVERIAITDDALKHSWGDAVYRVKLSSVASVTKAAWRLELRAV